MTSTTFARRTAAVLASAVLGGTIALAGAGPAHAAPTPTKPALTTWKTVKTLKQSTKVSYGKKSVLAPKFVPAPGKTYRYCVKVTGNGTVVLSGGAFTTEVKASKKATVQCTKAVTIKNAVKAPSPQQAVLPTATMKKRATAALVTQWTLQEARPSGR